MSSELMVAVRGLGKRYKLIPRGTRPGTLTESILGALRGKRPPKEDFWALREVCFEVRRGEVIGLLGHNGAGKSTLLKLLSRITEPTEGELVLYGRIGSLLEVGTGFHPELTGRENIFMNGSILGMSRREIQARYDEIVAFAGPRVEQHLDTPVKRYSSGMTMRLGFAVAANLNPEILIVDEVLAVGDAEFQKKCLGKMHDVAQSGRTVFFVSHNLAAVTALCTRALLLHNGELREDGPIAQVAQSYQLLAQGSRAPGGELTHALRTGTGQAQITALSIRSTTPDGQPVPLVYPGATVTLELTIQAREPLPDARLAVTLSDANTYRLLEVSTTGGSAPLRLTPDAPTRVCFVLPDLRLRPGLYPVGASLTLQEGEELDTVERAGALEVAVGAEPMPSGAGPYLCRYESIVSSSAC